MTEPLPLFLLVVGCLLLCLYIFNTGMAYSRMWTLFRRLQQTESLFCQWPIQCQRIEIGETRNSRRRPCVVMLTDTGFSVYPKSRDVNEVWTFQIADLRWFGRPQKYTPSFNELWLHFEAGGRWQMLKIRASHNHTMTLVRLLKTLATEELVVAYRRQRPYIHFGPVAAQAAEQDIHGGWSLNDSVQLFLNPISLVVLNQTEVIRTLPLLNVRKIAALKRMDTPSADGLVRFLFQGETLCYTLPKHEDFAKLLALAAKRSLEDPLIEKGKKDDEEAEYRHEEFEDDRSLDMFPAGFVVGDDGEIQVRSE